MKNKSEVKPYLRSNRSKWAITYRISGYKNAFYESFDSFEEANLRAAEINLARANGVLHPPRKGVDTMITLGDFLDVFVDVYGTTHWGTSQYSVCTRQIRDYIKPAPISSLLLRDVQTADIDLFYLNLLTTPAVLRSGHTVCKQIGISVIEKIHATLRCAFNQAVRWGYISRNPVEYAELPRVEKKKRDVWTPEDALKAISICNNKHLKVCMLVSIGCSLRLGEILGLQWDHIHITDESILNNSSTMDIKQELNRCDRASLEALNAKNRSGVYFVFPDRKVANECKTALVLKKPKTSSSVRTVYIPNTVAEALLELKADQEIDKKKNSENYKNYNMVFAFPNGRPVEARFIEKEFASLIQYAELPPVVFHSLRHLSTSIKLQLSGGDIKAVQGDTGHSQASMVTQVYGHTFNQNRKAIADKMQSTFFNPGNSSTSPSDSNPQLEYNNADPEILTAITTLLTALAKR